MERFQHRRSGARVLSPSNFTSIIDWRSDYNRALEGNQITAKEDPYSKFSPESSSGSSEITSEDLLAFDLGRSTSRLPPCTSMKKLLANERSRETESKRRPASVIAKLMGLDGLPPQQNTSKQVKRHSDEYQQRTSVGHHKGSKLSDNRLHRKNAKELDEFTHASEVMRGTRMKAGNYPRLDDRNLNDSEDGMSFIRQKFMDVKRLATDENFQDSKEFHDALEVLDSNKDLLLRFLQDPDSLFTKHMLDLHGTPQSHCKHVRSVSSSSALKDNIDAIGSHSGREASRKIDISSSHRHYCSHHCDFHCRHGIDSHKPYSILAEEKEDSTSIPTRIVVLKPNVGKVHNTAKSVSRQPEFELQSQESLTDELQIYGHESWESRELAKEIAQKMRNKLGKDSFIVDMSGYKGYSADESSHELSGNDSSFELETAAVVSENPDWKDRNSPSTSRCTESFVSREAKKRLSERWKITHRSQAVGSVTKGSTLGEMLAVPVAAVSPANSSVSDKSSGRLGRNEEAGGWVAPLGISSRDGWKEGCIGSLSRSKSLPASPNHFRSPKSRTRHEAFTAERFLIPKEDIGRERIKSKKRDFFGKEGSSSGRMRYVQKKSQSSVDICEHLKDDIQKTQFSRNQLKSGFQGRDSLEVEPVLPETLSRSMDASLTPADGNMKQVDDSECRTCPDGLSSASTADVPEQDGSSTCNRLGLTTDSSAKCCEEGSAGLCCPATQPESPGSSKETDQPSPVSVLEASFVEDNSSGSECFERVGAELHGLRLQLQLLKQASDEFDEGSMLISSDEDNEEIQSGINEENRVVGDEENWESSYLRHTLTHSGLDETDPNLFVASWHSLECPVGPWVFEKLEKKYIDHHPSRSERKLLFDRINSRIIEIVEPFMDPHPWIKGMVKSLSPRWKKDGLRTELKVMIGGYEKKATDNGVDAVVQSDKRWMELGDEIDGIGRDIERMLTEEMVMGALPI